MHFDPGTQSWQKYVDLDVGSDRHFTQEVDPGQWRAEFSDTLLPFPNGMAPTAFQAGTSEHDDKAKAIASISTTSASHDQRGSELTSTAHAQSAAYEVWVKVEVTP